MADVVCGRVGLRRRQPHGLHACLERIVADAGVDVIRDVAGLVAHDGRHDSPVNAGVPSAMVFVRNENGSHNPKEAMNLDDFVAGIAVMRAAIEEAVQ